MMNAFFGDCPTCFHNFMMQFCDMTCRPDHDTFLEITQTVEDAGR